MNNIKKQNSVSGYTRWTLSRHGLQRAEEEINEMMDPVPVTPFQHAVWNHGFVDYDVGMEVKEQDEGQMADHALVLIFHFIACRGYEQLE